MALPVPTMFELQFMQLQHDRTFHTDVFHLETKRKLYHYTAHLYKYISEVYVATTRSPAFTESTWLSLEKATNDMFIILMSTANLFNIKLQTLHNSHTSPTAQVKNHDELVSGYTPTGDISWVIQDAFITMGRVSKICEGLDHLENFNMKQEFDVILYKLLGISCLIRRWASDKAKCINITPTSVDVSICMRLETIQRKNIHWSGLQSSMHHRYSEYFNTSPDAQHYLDTY